MAANRASRGPSVNRSGLGFMAWRLGVIPARNPQLPLPTTE
jgi:hypothetical protein